MWLVVTTSIVTEKSRIVVGTKVLTRRTFVTTGPGPEAPKLRGRSYEFGVEGTTTTGTFECSTSSRLVLPKRDPACCPPPREPTTRRSTADGGSASRRSEEQGSPSTTCHSSSRRSSPSFRAIAMTSSVCGLLVAARPACSRRPTAWSTFSRGLTLDRQAGGPPQCGHRVRRAVVAGSNSYQRHHRWLPAVRCARPCASTACSRARLAARTSPSPGPPDVGDFDIGRRVDEGAQGGGSRRAQGEGAVATLKEEGESAGSRSEGSHQLGQLGEVPGGQGQFAERVGSMGIESARDEHPIWSEAINHRLGELVEGTAHDVTGGPEVEGGCLR